MTSIGKRDFYFVGGTLGVDEPSYVERKADRDLVRGLSKGEFCYVLTSRQLGKSSLMVRTAQRLRERGHQIVVLDLTSVGQNLSPEQWYDGLNLRVGRQLHLEDEFEDYWQAHARMGPCQRWFSAIREVGLERLCRPSGTPAEASKALPELILFVDELDAVRSLPFPTVEFFTAIRECYNRRAEDPLFRQLTFCVLGVAAPWELMTDEHTTPFNLGRGIELADFAEAETEPLVRGLAQASSAQPALDVSQLIKRILYWTNGHPYLTQRLFRAVAEAAEVGDAGQEEVLVDRLCHELFLSGRARESDDNLLFVRERLLRTKGDLAVLLELYERIWNKETIEDNELDPTINQLRLSGIVRVTGKRLVVRNRIYEHVFGVQWIQANKPVAELELPDGQRIRLRGASNVGRTDSSDIALPNIKVSRRHAMIQRQGQDEMWLVDTGSRNGTYLNGSRITRPMLLRDRDRIDIGPYRITFHQPNARRKDASDQTTVDRTVCDV